MPLFDNTKDRKLLEGINKEMYELYMHKIKVFKLISRTETWNDIYHEDINMDITADATYEVPGYADVNDNGLANLYKQGQQLDRSLFMYMSRKGLEDVLILAGLDKYRDVPTDGDVIILQNLYWEVMTADPEGYHMNFRDFPFDFQFAVTPWVRTGVPKDADNAPLSRY